MTRLAVAFVVNALFLALCVTLLGPADWPLLGAAGFALFVVIVQGAVQSLAWFHGHGAGLAEAEKRYRGSLPAGAPEPLPRSPHIQQGRLP